MRGRREHRSRGLLGLAQPYESWIRPHIRTLFAATLEGYITVVLESMPLP